MGLFDWLNKKQSATTQAIVAMMSPSQPVWTPRRYDRFAEEGYQKNVWVYACVSEIAKALSGLDLVLYRVPKSSGARVRELDAHPLLDLLARPNAEQGMASFVRELASYYLLQGNAYIEAARPTSRVAPPKFLYALRPDRMTVLPDRMNRVGGYRYEVNGQHVDFVNGEILHWKTFHPLNDWYGMAPIEAAARTVDADNSSDEYNVGLLQNGGFPSMFLLPEGDLTPGQMETLGKQLREKHSGPQNGGRVGLLPGIKDVKQMGLSPDDLAIAELSQWTAQKIASVYGVPGELIGLKPATFENRREASRVFFANTVLPLADELIDHLNNWLVPMFGDGLRLDVDRDAIDALQEDREKLWKSVRGATWLTVNEQRVATGYDEIEGGDVFARPVREPSEERDPEEKSRRPRSIKAKGKAIELGSEAHKAAWSKFDRRVKRHEARFKAMITGILEEQRDELVKRYRQSKSRKAIGDWFDRDYWQQEFARRAQIEMLAAAQDAGDAVFDELTIDGSFDVHNPEVTVFISEMAQKFAEEVNATTWDRLRVELADGEEAGESIDKLAERIAEVMGDRIRSSAETIARTETIKALNGGALRAAAQSGVVGGKQWLATFDGRERDTHAQAHAKYQVEPIPLGADFHVGTAKGEGPGMLDEAGESINCRCTLTFVLTDD